MEKCHSPTEPLGKYLKRSIALIIPRVREARSQFVVALDGSIGRIIRIGIFRFRIFGQNNVDHESVKGVRTSQKTSDSLLTLGLADSVSLREESCSSILF